MTVPSSRSVRPLALLLTAALALGAAGCGRAKTSGQASPAKGAQSSARGDTPDAVADLGFPTLATKNTTRVAAADPVAAAAAVSQIVYPSTRPADRPAAVTLVDAGDWRAALAASALNGAPLKAPTLFTKGTSIPAATSKALATLSPTGSKAAGGAQVIRVGTLAKPGLLRTTDIQTKAADAFALARKIDAFVTAARGRPTSRILLVSADDPAYAAPAAAWAATSGDTILFTHKDNAPPDTIAAIKAHRRPTIYILGPSSVISPKVTRQIRKLGTYHRIGGQDPVANAIGFAVYADGDFGWGATTPGHGLVLIPANADPATAAAAAPLSASGTYGPSLLLSSPAALDGPLGGYLKDIQPGFDMNAARGFYNHAWLIGDTQAITPALQAAVDAELESRPIDDKSAK